MNNHAEKRQFHFIVVSLLAISAIGAFLVAGCSSEPGKTEAASAGTTGGAAAPPAAPAPGAPPGPGAPPPGAVAGGGVGERINK